MTRLKEESKFLQNRTLADCLGQSFDEREKEREKERERRV